MDIRCGRCGAIALPAGHEDARAFYQCEKCNRVWMVHLTAGTAGRTRAPAGRVLVVDDADGLVSLIAMWLEDEGYEVTTAASGREAIEEIRSHDFDVILLDLVIPPPDGLAICRFVSLQEHPAAIVVMTGVSEPARLHDVEGAGIFALLHKPLTQDEVLEAVSRARRQQRPMAHG